MITLSYTKLLSRCPSRKAQHGPFETLLKGIGNFLDQNPLFICKRAPWCWECNDGHRFSIHTHNKLFERKYNLQKIHQNRVLVQYVIQLRAMCKEKCEAICVGGGERSPDWEALVLGNGGVEDA